MNKKNIFLKYITVLILALISFSCGNNPISPQPPDNAYKVSIKQGVWGNVWFWEGNFMPGDGNTSGKITPVVREIYIYEATKFNEVERDSCETLFL